MQQQAFYFSEGPYLQALQSLHAALAAPEAFVKLLGKPHTGKSAICDKLTQFMRHEGYRVVYFSSAVESPEMLRIMLARQFKIPVSSNFTRLLEDVLEFEDDRPLVIIFDDAHLLTDITLLEIYRLAEVQVNDRRMLNILLCGEPSLEKRMLSNQEFKSLLLGVSDRYLLGPMDRETLAQFFYRFAEKHGVPGLQLDAAAMSLFYKSCRGYPGPAASLCQLMVTSREGDGDLQPLQKQDLLPLFRSADNQHLPVNVIDELSGSRMLAPIAVVLVLASTGFIYQQLRDSAQPVEQSSLPGDAETGVASPFESAAPPPSNVVAVDTPDQQIPAEVVPVEPQLLRDSVEVQADSTTIVPPSDPPELPEPVSDSALALVTAQERGISSDAIAQPVFESVDASQALETEQAELVADEPVAELPVAAIDSGLPTSQRAIEVAADTAVLAAADSTGTSSDQPAPVPPASVDQALIQEPEPRSDSVEIEAPSSSADDLAGFGVEGLQSVVQLWLNAWQQQSLDDYFDSYHSRFIPRYHDTVEQWRSNRRRVIGDAESIRLQIRDFQYIGEEQGVVNVQFWLRYESPGYSDETQKRLLLSQELGRLKILEEINLQVRRL